MPEAPIAAQAAPWCLSIAFHMVASPKTTAIAQAAPVRTVQMFAIPGFSGAERKIRGPKFRRNRCSRPNLAVKCLVSTVSKGWAQKKSDADETFLKKAVDSLMGRRL